MGEYGYGPGLGTGYQTPASPGPAVQTYPTGGGGPSGYQPRGFPERVAAEQLIPKQTADNPLEFIDKVVFRWLPYTLERPVAAAATLLGMPPGESPLDPVANFFGDLPIVGEHLRNAGS